MANAEDKNKSKVLQDCNNIPSKSDSFRNDDEVIVDYTSKVMNSKLDIASKTPFENDPEQHQVIENAQHFSMEEKENSNDEKPKMSFIALIDMAIRSSPQQKQTLGGILNFIKEKFPYYRKKDSKWHGSIRHNLSLNECFVKVKREQGAKGHGNYWMIDPAAKDMFKHGSLQRRKTRIFKQFPKTGSSASKCVSVKKNSSQEPSASSEKKNECSLERPSKEKQKNNQQKVSQPSTKIFPSSAGPSSSGHSSSQSNAPGNGSILPPSNAQAKFKSAFSIDSLLQNQTSWSPAVPTRANYNYIQSQFAPHFLQHPAVPHRQALSLLPPVVPITAPPHPSVQPGASMHPAPPSGFMPPIAAISPYYLQFMLRYHPYWQ